MIAPDSETVGIDIAHNGLVNRTHINRDFTTRNLKIPNQLIVGDSADFVVQNAAKTKCRRNQMPPQHNNAMVQTTAME